MYDGRASFVLRSDATSTVKLNSGVQIAVAWLLHVHVCGLGRRSSVVLCKAVIADRTGVVASRWCLELRNRTQPCVFWHKVAPGVDVGNLVCATGASFVRFALGRLLHRKVEFRGADRSGMAASMLLSKGEWHRQTRMSRVRNVKDKEVQEITKPTAG